jgi:hypothetical protein
MYEEQVCKVHLSLCICNSDPVVWTIHRFGAVVFLWQILAILRKTFSKKKTPFSKATPGSFLNSKKTQNNVIIAYNMKGRSRFHTFIF